MSADAPAKSWRETAAIYTHPRVISLLFLGFSAGLPLLLVFSTLSYWVREANVSLTTIGFLSWIGVTYSTKFVWSPVVDRMPLPFLTRWLGRRRSWMLLAQVGIAGGLFAMTRYDPAVDLWWIVAFAVLVAFSSATQDIALDAFRIEATDETLQGATAATYQLGYRIAMLAAGAGTLYIAAFASWTAAYQAMAALALVGIVTTLLISEPDKRVAPGTVEREDKIAAFAQRHAGLPSWLLDALVWIYGAIVCPFVDFFVRYRWMAVVMLAFISLFRLSDIAMGVMANPFYVDIGFTKEQVANISKIYGVLASMAGALLGGVLVFRWGAARLLALSVLLLAVSNLTFAGMAYMGKADVLMLTAAISVDNVSSGIAGTVFIAFLSGLTNTAYTATQYALFTSIMLLPGKLIGGFSGLIVDWLQADLPATFKFGGYAIFFVYTALLGLPALVLAVIVRRHFEKETPPS
ncbi:AmpG family muropeptide MFS transporter [Reyranella sp.]|uniref:AmpG family muropeptide MFS transporter n=1 Tax=Reyranella sp. TaxID=1929291 RepID=UPI003C7A0101